MKNIKYNYNYSTLYIKTTKTTQTKINQAIKDYNQILNLTQTKTKKHYQIKLKLLDKKNQNLKTLSQELLTYIQTL